MGDLVNTIAFSPKYSDMRALAAHAAACFPDARFFLCADKELPCVTGAELFALCRKAALVLDEIGEHRHIAVLGPSSAAWLASYFAVLSAGRVIVPLHDGMQQQELADCIRLADCGMLLYDERRGETALALSKAVPGLRLLELHAFIEQLRAQEGESLPELKSNAVAAMYFTSGTTGQPRCVMLTHRNIVNDGKIIGDRMDTDVIAGIEADLDTVLVLSGVTSEADLKRFAYRPTYVMRGLDELVARLEE